MTDAEAPLNTHDHLLQAALFCFAEHGFDGTSLRMVADLAGKHMSLIAHHFQNKEGLYLKACAYALELCQPHFEADAFLDAETLRGDRARLLQAFRRPILLSMMDVQRALAEQDPIRLAGMKLWAREIRAPRASLIPLIKERMKPLHAQWRACIRALKPEFTDAEVDFWASAIHGLCLAHPWMMSLNRIVWDDALQLPSLEITAEAIAAFSLRGLSA